MFNFFKRLFVRFSVRKLKLVKHRETGDHFILSFVSKEGYIMLLTQYDSYIALQYSVFKKNFVAAPAIMSVGEELAVLGIEDNTIKLSSGASVRLGDINEQPDSEEGADFF